GRVQLLLGGVVLVQRALVVLAGRLVELHTLHVDVQALELLAELRDVLGGERLDLLELRRLEFGPPALVLLVHQDGGDDEHQNQPDENLHVRSPSAAPLAYATTGEQQVFPGNRSHERRRTATSRSRRSIRRRRATADRLAVGRL